MSKDIITASDEEEEETTKERKPYLYYEQAVQTKIHHFYISEGIGAPDKYIDMIHKIRMAGPEETVCIHLNSPGGSIDTGVQLINAMRASQANIVASVESEACSLATMIFLAADEMVVHDDCIMMFHNFTAGAYGKGHELKANVKGVSDWIEAFMRRLYVPFLTEKEFERLLKGEDFWMQSDEIRNRLAKMVAAMEKELKAKARELKALEKQLDEETKKKVTKKKVAKKKVTKKKVTKKKTTHKK